MATVSSHALNAVDGSHAAGIAVALSRISADGSLPIFATCLDDGGRFSEDIELDDGDTAATYELVFATGPYWIERGIGSGESRLVREIVLRFEMPDPNKRYHLPVILSPNSYTAWFSA